MSEGDKARRFYVERRKLRRSIRVRHAHKRRLPPEEAVEYIHLTACFTHLVMQACKRHGVTPQTATGNEFDLPSLMSQAELLVYPDPSKVSAPERERRRKYAYSAFLRTTSAGVRL